MISAPYMQPVIDRFVEEFHAQGIRLTSPIVRERMEESDLLPIIGQFDGVICGDDRFSRSVLSTASKLKVISKWGTGIDSIDRSACEEFGIRLCNTPGAFTIPVADSTMAYLLALARRSFEQTEQMREGGWAKLSGVTLSECTVGIIGVGAIGREVARRVSVCGARVLGHDPIDPPSHVIASTGIQMVGFDRLLKESDFITIHCDLNPTSHRLIDRIAISQMKSTAYLVNTARGPIVEEFALTEALLSRRIAGAALDVFEVEPLPKSSPLRGLKNVLLAAHNSNSSPVAWERVHRNTIDNLIKGLNEVQRKAA